MKQHCKWIMPAVVVLALGLPFAGQAQSQPVYTWVDKSGVRHYSDTPHNPQAVLVTVQAGAARSAPAVATVPVAGSTSKARHMMPQPQPRETPAERRARCSKLRRKMMKMQSARRVEVTRDGTQRFYSGDDLVQFRRQMHKRMQVACASSAH